MHESNGIAAPTYRVLSVSKIIGQAVVNRRNEVLGRVRELVINAGEGRPAYAVLSVGGFLGIGGRLFAMPWTAIEFTAADGKLVLNVDKEQLKAASRLDEDAGRHSIADRVWRRRIYSYCGSETR